jgi:hypothetical protein
MKCGHTLSVFLIVLISALPSFAADRLTDRDLKELVARIEEGRDRFDNALDDQLKRSILRSPSGEVDINRYLNDFQESIDRLEERLKPEYAASAEVETLLRRASGIDAFLREQPPGTRGESEWNQLTTHLNTLASAYGTEFPLTQGATVRRMGDREVAGVADEVARGAERLKKSLDTELKQDANIDKQTREGIVREADQMSKDAKLLRDRVKDGEPSSAETTGLLARATKLQTILNGHQAPTSAKVWTGITPRLQTVAGAYGVSWPSSR